MAATSNALTLAAGARLAPRGRSARPAAAPSPRRRLAVAVRAMSEADMYQGVDSSPQLDAAPAPAGGPPLYVVVPAALGGLIAALRVARMAKKKMSQGSRLEERGFKRGGVADDRAYTQAMKAMRTVQYDELSPEVIEAARRRRRREVEKDAAPMDLEQIDLPDNHPFAVKKQLAPEEEALQRRRLSARRGLSAEDMQRLREQQALADQMDAEEEARQAARRARG